ncbi:MAG: M48 family metallopeptidase [Desulfobacteraceae bacterium]|nr:MAG: M48 family metallopeptidase [Desulfobacteraceae bacterium]
MIAIKGYWYDGRTSAQTAAVFRVYDNGAIGIEDSENGTVFKKVAGFDISVSPRLAETPRYLYFTTGEKFETEDNEAVDHILKRLKQRSWMQAVHYLEARRLYVLICLATVLLFMFGAIKFGVPAASKSIAFHLPLATAGYAGRQTLEILDRSVFKPSELDEEVKFRLTNHLQPVIDDHSKYGLKILFRKGGRVGPNAFALPSGIVIFTDEMVKISGHDNEMLAVLAHEAGHVVHRHALRTVIQDSLLSFALLAITGDISGSSELFLGLPVILTQLSYSRNFEQEADDYAVDYLRSHNIPTVHFAELLLRLDKKKKPDQESSSGTWTGYLSTHPLTEERVQQFKHTYK